MSVAGIIVVLAAIVGGFSVLLALSEAWLLGSDPIPDVGPWKVRRPVGPPPPTMPHELRTLGWGEQSGWHEPEQWSLLCTRLFEIEVELGGRPPRMTPPPPPPARYDPQWLEQRLRQLEQLSGPLPAPWTERQPTPRKKWKIR